MPVFLWTAPAPAQRIQFPTTVAQAGTGAANTSPNLLTPPSTSTYQSPTATYPPSSTYTAPTSTYQVPNTYTQPSQGYNTQSAQGYPQQTPGYGQQTPGYGQQTPGYGQSAPGYVPQGSYNYASPAAPSQLQPAGSASAPGAISGGVQAPGTWDPYAAPCPSSTPTPLLSQDPYFQYGQPAVPAMAMTRALQEIRLDYHWFDGQGNQGLGINDIELNATFAIPFYNLETPFMITPGFAMHYWQGPVSLPPPPPTADLPPRTYDAYVGAAWNPQVLPWLGAELSFRIGLYDDFVRKITTDSIRYTGTGLGVVSISPNVKLKAGVMYLDRNYIKLLPSGGIVWTPNPDWYFNILFPNPKVAKRLTNTGGTEWWLYCSGDYGGGAWHITRGNPDVVPPSPVAGQYDDFDYNDIRVAVGLEFKTYRNFKGLFEVGGAFSRQLYYTSESPANYYPTNTVFLRGGLAY
jgi:hypothetical protein